MGDGDDDHPIHQINTVPPPNGADDAYSAETKIGTSDAALQEFLRAAKGDIASVADDDDVGHEDATRLFPLDGPPDISTPAAPKKSSPGPSTVEVAPDVLAEVAAARGPDTVPPAAAARAASQPRPFPLLPVSLAIIAIIAVAAVLITR
jgi:hypothetical protein